jgi:hypothetical protein
MRPHGKSDRRHRGHKGHDDELYIGAHGDEPRAETYSHHNEAPHRTESYRTSSTAHRSSYDANREASTSRTQRHSDPRRRGDHEEDRHHYPSDEEYRRHGRNEYEDVERRTADAWSSRSHNDAQYIQSRGEYSQRYDLGYASSSYAESSSWNASNPPPHDIRSIPFDHWAQEDPQPDDRHGVPVVDERHLERDPTEWQRDQRREKGNQKFQSDSGWDSRRRKGWGDPAWDDPSRKKDTSSVDNRSWEPAPTWQPSGRGDYEHASRSNQRNNNANRSAKGGKRSVYPVKSKRDWRNDDGSLNKFVYFIQYLRSRSAKFILQLAEKRQRWHSREGVEDSDTEETPTVIFPLTI